MRDTAQLLAEGWGCWRGAWTSCRRLRRDTDCWRLEEDGRELDCWPQFSDAVSTLWKQRATRDDSPWAIGWLGYEECAEIGGRLPARSSRDSEMPGLFLLEPQLENQAIARVGGPDSSQLVCSLDDESFRTRVDRILDLIEAGQIYQANLTRCFRAGWKGGLRSLVEIASRKPPPYLSWFSGREYELLCTSMELLLRRRGTMLETAPIKGTRPRGSNPEEDLRLIAELDTDAKERAELAMVVDLERNDLGRIAKSGSVRVVDPGTVITYANVHHRVAKVEAESCSGLPWWEAIAAMVPGGSVTGCPKWAAMKTIVELEPVPRGPYTGALGLIAGNGDFELALPIRTVWRSGPQIAFAAGCGIVWGSDPQREQLESRTKVAPWLDIVCGDWRVA
ncbi:MAG: anthranilate synthase component I family protein [bacterium]|nr:anthranilate synthase component I family protein [bacterium]